MTHFMIIYIMHGYPENDSTAFLSITEQVANKAIFTVLQSLELYYFLNFAVRTNFKENDTTISDFIRNAKEITHLSQT